MRWERLFEDLEAQLRLEDTREQWTEVAELTRAARGEVGLVDRLVAARGSQLQVQVLGAGALAAVLVDVGQDWMLLAQPQDAGRSTLVRTENVLHVRGLPVRSDASDRAASRPFDIRRALRAISRDRAPVQITDTSGAVLTGTIDRVGRDHCDVADHAVDVARRAQSVRGAYSIPYAALATVTSRGS